MRGCDSALLAALLVFGLGAAGGGDPAESSASTSAPRVEVLRIDGVAVSGVLKQLVPQVLLESAAESFTIEWSDVMVLTPVRDETTSRPAHEGESSTPLQFELSEGSRFGGAITGLGEGDLLVRLSDRQEARVPAGAIRAVYVRGAVEAPRAKFAALATGSERVAAEREKLEDIAVVSKDGQPVVLRGAVRKLDAAGCTFGWNSRDVVLPWEKLAGVLFSAPQERRAQCRVAVRCGDIFAGKLVGGDSAEVELRSGVFAKLVVAWSEIERIDVSSERLVFASDLRVQSYEFDPLFGPRWEYSLDRDFSGRPIMLDGRRFAKGVVMHSASRLVFALGGNASRFAATVGVVDAYADHGDARLKIIGDGKVLWEASRVRGRGGADISIDLAGVNEFVLVVERGENLDLGDHVAWASARFIRE